MEIVLIVAVADNGVIGAGGAIPWRLKTDLQRFKTMTMGRPVVMGRKTFMSLRRPLPGRTNIVMTRDGDFRGSGRFVTEIAVIGGAEIYARWIDFADRLEVTEVHARPAGDTCFTPIDKADWEEIARVRHRGGPDDSADFSFVTYVRRRPH
jgi:dihydrofolate reductase